MGGSAQVDACVAGVANDVSADGVNCVAEELVWLSHNLVSYNCHGVECSGKVRLVCACACLVSADEKQAFPFPGIRF